MPAQESNPPVGAGPDNPSAPTSQPPPLGGGQGEGFTLVPPAGNFDPLRFDAANGGFLRREPVNR